MAGNSRKNNYPKLKTETMWAFRCCETLHYDCDSLAGMVALGATTEVTEYFGQNNNTQARLSRSQSHERMRFSADEMLS